MCVSWPQQGSGWEEPISVAEAVHISFADLPAPSARWPATCVHMVSGNNNSEKMKNASHSLQTNGYSAIPGKLSQSRQLPGLKKKGVKREWGPREPPDRKRVGTVTSKKGVDIEGKSKFPKAVFAFCSGRAELCLWPAQALAHALPGLQTTATINALLPGWTLIAHRQVIPQTSTSGILKPCDSAGLDTFWGINRLSFTSRFLPYRGLVCQSLWYQNSRPLEERTHGETLEGSPKPCLNRNVLEEGTRAMTTSNCWHDSELLSHTKFEETNLSVSASTPLLDGPPQSPDKKLATIQKKAQQLCGEMYGICTTAKCEKATACNVGKKINHF